MKINRADVPLTLPPELIRRDVQKAVQLLNEALQREYRRRIEIEARLDRIDRIIYGPTEQQAPQPAV